MHSAPAYGQNQRGGGSHMNWTFGRKLALGFAFAVAVILCVGVAGRQNIVTLIEASEWVDHTHRVIQTLTQLESAVTDSETSTRGFTLTGNEEMLDPHEQAKREIGPLEEQVRRLTSDNPEQQKRLERLVVLIDQKLRIVEGNIDARRSGGLEAGATRTQSAGGLNVMQDIRRLVHDMINAETALLDARARENTASAEAAKSVILWGSLIGTLLIIVMGTQISSSLTKQIGAAVGHIQASSAELQAAANQQAAGATEQATAVSEVTTTIGELLATSRQIAESAQRVSAIAGRTADTARSGDSTVNHGNQSMIAIRRQVDSIVNQMLELGKKSQQIGAVLDIVSELA